MSEFKMAKIGLLEILFYFSGNKSGIPIKDILELIFRVFLSYKAIPVDKAQNQKPPLVLALCDSSIKPIMTMRRIYPPLLKRQKHKKTKIKEKTWIPDKRFRE